MSELLQPVYDLISRGGIVMYPLIGLSVIGLAVIIERAWFWMHCHSHAQSERFDRLLDAIGRHDDDGIRRLVKKDRSPYAAVARRLVEEHPTKAGLLAGVESERPRLERWMSLLSTIITAAPMLGILGTVIGIITSFRLIGNREALTDPTQVSGGIAEALITTAAGLVIALVILFPYMAFRAQVERSLGRLETLLAAADDGWFGGRTSGGGVGRSGGGGAEHSGRESVERAAAAESDAGPDAGVTAIGSTRASSSTHGAAGRG